MSLRSGLCPRMFPLLREQPVLLAAKKLACGALSVVSFFKRREFPDPLRCRSEISTMDEVGMTETQINVLSTCFDVDFWGEGRRWRMRLEPTGIPKTGRGTHDPSDWLSIPSLGVCSRRGKVYVKRRPWGVENDPFLSGQPHKLCVTNLIVLMGLHRLSLRGRIGPRLRIRSTRVPAEVSLSDLYGIVGIISIVLQRGTNRRISVYVCRICRLRIVAGPSAVVRA